jgi:hypothetical protein
MAIETDIPAIVSTDAIHESAVSDAAVLADFTTKDETQDHGHKTCPTQLLFRSSVRTTLFIKHRTTTISELRVGVATACHSCSIVLDAVTCHCSGRIPIETIATVSVPPENWPITVTYRLVSDTRKLRGVLLELFTLEGKLQA